MTMTTPRPRLRDKVLAATSSVTHVESLTEHLLRVRFDRPRDMVLTAGTHIAVRVDAGPALFGTWRRYTVSRLDETSIEIIAYLHGDGPGANTLGALQPGCTLSFRFSDPPITLPADVPAMIVADESAIGTVIALLDSAPRRATVILHALDAAAAVPLIAGPNIELVPIIDRADDHRRIIATLKRYPSIPLIVALGQRDTVRDVRRWARTSAPDALVHHRTYWAPGKTGLE